MVRSFTAGDVTIKGTNAFALVSHGDVRIGGIFTASATDNRSGPSAPGPGRFNDVAAAEGTRSFKMDPARGT
jgi:hypothetical protein